MAKSGMPCFLKKKKMKHTCLIFCLFASASFAQPSIKWERVKTIDVKHIALDLRFDWTNKQAYGSATITLSPVRPSGIVSLDGAMLTINSVELINGTKLKFEYDGSDRDDAIRIMLDREYNPGDDVVLKIDYRTNHVNAIDPSFLSGSNGKGLRFSAPTSNDPTKPKEIWSMGDPQFNRYWFPCYDSPNDLRTTELRATVHSNLTVISNGTLVETQTGSNTKTFRWKMDTPYANHLTALAVGEYIDIPQTYDNITLHNFGYPREKDATTASVERVSGMMRFFSEKTGVKYPHKSYSQVFVQDLPWGIGYNTLSTQSENMVDDWGTHRDFLYLWDALEGETMAQQWFGSYVSYRDWSDVWLSKGFGIYFSRLYNEYKNGHSEFLLFQPSGSDLNTYLWEWNGGSRHPVVTKNYESPAVFATYDNYPTLRAGLVLHMLRKHLGDETWWKSINLFLKRNAHQSVTTEDFRRAVEDASGEPMDWFFDQWIYRMGHPVFEITKNYDAPKQQLTLKVIQTQGKDSTSTYPQTEFFRGKVAIEIDNDIQEVWLEGQKENTFVFAKPVEPKLVNFDFEGTWIKEITFHKSFDELLHQLQYSNDVLARRAAITELVAIAKEEDTKAKDKAKVTAALHSLIQSNAYWRLKLSALSQLQPLATPPDAATIRLLLSTIQKEKSWARATAISFLGSTRSPKYADIYIKAFKDTSDRVINQAAIALGKSKSPKAFDALVKLTERPSWKNQSLMSALAGLQELGDPRGYDVAFNALKDLNLLRWRLPTPPVWDFRVMAVETIVKLGRAGDAYPWLLDRFNASMTEDDLEGIFNNTLLIVKLGDARGLEIFPKLREKYKSDSNALTAVDQYETQLREHGVKE